MTAQTSEHGGYIRGQLVANAGDPADTAATRVLANNILHSLDQSGQVLCSLSALAADDIQAPSASTTFQLIRNLDLFPYVRVRHGDGSTFRVVVYMRALASAASTVTYRVALRFPETRLTVPLSPSDFPSTNVAEVSTTSTTGADLTATVYLASPALSGRELDTLQSTDGSGDALSSYALGLSLQVWAKSSGAGVPRARAFTAREYVGER